MPQPRPRRQLVRALACALAVLCAVPIAMLQGAPQAAADTTQFRGVNWGRLGDNFYHGPLVLHGLSSSDSYTTVVAKANAVYTGFQNNLGANTVRLPINTYTVGTAWWNSYTGVIDAATAKGFKVVLSYWDDGVAANGSRIVNLTAFNNMWNTVVAKYGTNELVYFEPMNEPAGHSASDWANVVNNWISSRPSIPRNRIFVSGAGLNQDIKSMCADRRFDGTFLSLHHYTIFSGAKTYDQWVTYLRNAIGSCGARTVMDEFGAPMDTGLNYNDANSTDNFVRYLRATATVLREQRMGSIYWPGLGGKIHAGQSDDWYAMQKLHGTGTNLTLTTPSVSGRDRLRYGWGLDPGVPTPTPPTPTTPAPTTPAPTTPAPTTPAPTTPAPTTPVPTTPGPGGNGCSASVSLDSWTGGFVATVRVTAGSAGINGWAVSVALPNGARVANAWSATASGSAGTVRFTNLDYNGRLGPGQATEFGFQGTGSGSGMTPTCTGS